MQYAPTYRIYLHSRNQFKLFATKHIYQTPSKKSAPACGIRPHTPKKISLNPPKSAPRLPGSASPQEKIRPISVQPVFPFNHILQKISARLRHPQTHPIKNQFKSAQISDPLAGFRVPFIPSPCPPPYAI